MLTAWKRLVIFLIVEGIILFQSRIFLVRYVRKCLILCRMFSLLFSANLF
jgi:hypothetical protein